jgi:serine/threonine protein kinase
MADAKIPDIGKYHIIELVGEGAMGVVYKAKDSVLDRTVAIKVMNESIARQDDLRKRFLHEAQAAASLQHPNVVCIYDLGEMDGHLFIAMEFVQGVDLEKLIEMGEPLSLQARLDIIIDVLAGLTFAHKRGIVHRDIKPANIRVAEDGRAKIMDFGVAHLASSSMTRTGSFLGTPSFMAPEQITDGKTTPATDIFAVGGVLYQLLTQLKPFDAPTLQSLFFKIITEKPRRVTELMPGLPPALDRIVEKALAKEPTDRYASALDMANDLSNVRAKLSGPSYPASISLSASVSSAIEQSRKVSRTRSRNFAFAGAGAAVAIAALIGWSQFAKSRSPGSTTDDKAAAAAAPSSPVTAPVQNTPVAAKTDASATPAPSSAQRVVKQEKPAPKVRDTRVVVPPRVTPRPSQSPVVSTAVPTNQAGAQVPAAQQVVAPPPAPVVVQRPVQEAPPAAPSPPTSADLAPSVEAYARAIESRDIGAIRRVNPGLTSDQQRNFEAFFQSARNINVTFRITNIEASGTSGEARLVGGFDYVNQENRNANLAVSLAATFRHEANGWRIVSVR